MAVRDPLDSHQVLVEHVRLPVIVELPSVARLFADADQRAPLAAFTRE